jgi:hypothetical protein
MSKVVGQLSLFAAEEVESSTPTHSNCNSGAGLDGVTALRRSGRTVGGEGASAGLAHDLEEAPVTATENFICPSCRLAGELSNVVGKCPSCRSAVPQ